MNMSDMGKQKNRGNAIGFWFFRMFLKFGGLYAAYGLLLGVALYYWIFDRNAVKTASAYLKRRFPSDSSLLIYFKVYKLFYSQGKQLIDRAAHTAGFVKFNFQLSGENILNDIKTSDKGCILLTAHAGNWQLAMATLDKVNKKIFLVMLPEYNKAVKKALNIDGKNNYIDVISPEGHLGGIVPVVRELNMGNVVSYMGDRAYGSESVEVEFMGDKAFFPCGAFAIAAAVKVPVVVVLASKTGTYSYKVDFTNIIKPEYKNRKNKRQQLSQWVQEYADILTGFFEKYPYQCFLFHDVWTNGRKDDLANA